MDAAAAIGAWAGQKRYAKPLRMRRVLGGALIALVLFAVALGIIGAVFAAVQLADESPIGFAPDEFGIFADGIVPLALEIAIFASMTLAFVLFPRWLLKERGVGHLMKLRRPDRRDARLALLAVALMAAVLAAYEAIVSVAGVDALIWLAGWPGPEPRSVDVANIVGFALLAVLAAPLIEEAFFRGFLFGGMRRAGGGRWALPAALLTSAALFAAAHIVAARMIPLAIHAVMLAVLYMRTRNLTAPTLAHGLWNAGAVTAPWLYWAAT